MNNPLSEPLSFDRVAAQYERTRPLPDAVADSVATHIAGLVGPDEWILDAGCGTGRFTRALAKQQARVVGADVSPQMLAELRRYQADFPQPVLVTSDLRTLPFPDAQFGAVLAIHVLHLIAEWRQALGEMWRVTAPGGFLLLGYEDRSPSQVRDFYMTEGQRRGLLPRHPGARNITADILPFLRSECGATDVESVSPPEWEWSRPIRVADMLADLDSRLYSSQWNIPEAAHREVMAATRANAKKVFGSPGDTKHETQETRFVLYRVRKGE